MAKDFYRMSPEQVLRELGTTRQGLGKSECEKRLKTDGPNAMARAEKKSHLKMFFRQFRDVMTIILLIAAGISMAIALYEKTWTELVDGLIILLIVFSNAFIGYWQEQKAEKSMNELKKLTQPEALVLRGGRVTRQSSESLVVGDVLVLESGAAVPADARLIDSLHLCVDESTLTGESVPAAKDHMAILPAGAGVSDQKNMVFAGTAVTSGRGLAVVVATGSSSQIGKIAGLLSEESAKETPLQKGIKDFAKITTMIVLFISVITFFVEVFISPTTPIDAFLTAVALAVAAIPESLPAVITIIISLGIFRLAKHKAIVKNLHALETLGSAQIICSDKTGTLTQNKMTTQKLFCGGKFFDAKTFEADCEEKQKMLEIMLLCESVEMGQGGWIGDPTELALVHFAEEKSKGGRAALEKKMQFVDEVPFDSARKLMTSVWAEVGQAHVLTKGAVDELLGRCTGLALNGNVVPLTAGHKEKILRANREMASGALRVLAFAHKSGQKSILNEKLEENLIFVGLAGMFDPPRKEVPRAVKKCHRAGVRPIMITGDHKNTAFAVAKQIGISESEDEVMTGAEIDRMRQADFEKVILKKRVFARVSPENKVRIVETLRAQKLLVAMTGDGVNDAPSIKKADIGIGMGQTGTDVTKEAADIIITDDNFATIVAGISEGRKTFANIKKTVQFLYTANLAEITAIFLATIFMPALVFLTPVQILFVNLVSDTLPAIALGVEPEEKDLMERPPRDVKKGLLSGGVGIKMLIMGLFQGGVMLGAFCFGLYRLDSPEIATTMAFYALNLVQFFYFFSMRTNGSIFENPIRQNKLALWAVGVCFGFVALVALTPLGTLLGVAPVPLSGWLIILLGCAMTFVFSEIVKRLKIGKDQ